MADEPLTADPSSPHPKPKGSPKGYSLREWKGMPLYQCDSCHFNSMQLSIIEDHVENALENNRRLGRPD